MKAYVGSTGMTGPTFILGLYGDKWSNLHPAILPPGKYPGTPGMRGWVTP